MTSPNWQLVKPVSAIVLDCDSTVSKIEGIDYLARNNGVGEIVRNMTKQAMDLAGLNPTLYQQRLDLVTPRREQVNALGHQYFAHRTPDIMDTIRLFKRLNKAVYLISAGVNPAVKMFGEMLEIDPEKVFAVDLRFDQQGNFIDFERNSPLINNDGKRHIIEKLKAIHPDIVHIGDGLNDVVTLDMVTRFIGFGGVTYRQEIADLCQYYVNTPSFAPVVPLILTQGEMDLLSNDEKQLYYRGLEAISNGQVRTDRSQPTTP